MDGLDEFEKALAEEKQLRESSGQHGKRERKNDARKRHHHHRSSHRGEDGDERQRKRSKHSRGDDGDERLLKERPAKASDSHENLPLPTDEEPASSLMRDSWMNEPSGLEIEYKQRYSKKEKQDVPPHRPNDGLKIHKNELNLRLNEVPSGEKLDNPKNSDESVESYTFGDSGAQWRMTKLKAVYTQAEQSGQPVEEIAISRFESLREFDEAREEQIELDRRALYGEGYMGKDRPSGELFRQRELESRSKSSPKQSMVNGMLPPPVNLEMTATSSIDQTTLNRMKAQLMKAQLRKSSDVSRLETEYNTALEKFTNNPASDVVILGKMDNRLLAGTRGEVTAIDNKRGRERGHVKDNEDMSIEDMVGEERRTKGQRGGDGMRAAERIAKDAKFDTDLDYMDENASKLAKRVQKSEVNLKNAAVGEFQKLNRLLDKCALCHHEDKNLPPIAPVISLATRVYLTLPTEPELSEGGAVIVPIQHRTNLLECDDDEWEEIRNFMKCLTRMYHEQGRDVVFYENAAAPHRKLHAAMQVVPLPYSLGETAPAFFREAILSSDEEWTQHKKLINTSARSKEGLGKLAFRRSIAKEMPYFHAWFDLDGGLGHIVEDSNRWPRGDLFAREIIGGMLDIEPDVIKKQGSWNRGDKRVDGFKKRWRKFDWTRVLTDE